MKMFLGEYNPNITTGNRIALPKKHREQLAENEVVLAKGFEKCVLVYDYKDWSERVERQVDNLTEASFANGNTKLTKRSDLERYLYTSATETSVDAQGRIVIPAHLLDYAEIKEATAVIGVGDHIEIWDLVTWQEHIKNIAESMAE
ncbi:division/cell wall cluster transcriptional repressor MraZ [Patescibacteria group bacterium]|nr:division/cell wall cluster transcriptional repressor MraZ [Patescibacteria group bacterium]